MKAEFWHERWERNEIGFHQGEFNTHMQAFIQHLDVPPGGHFLVPLCGKSLDMLWLAEQGFQVTGIELSERAVKDFFQENGLSYEVDRQFEATVYRTDRIEVRCMDFFDTAREKLPVIDAVYDRASLIALPESMRSLYAKHLAGLMRAGTDALLITLDYPQEEMTGPPFSVANNEVLELFSRQYRVEQLRTEDCLAREPRFRKKGLSRLDENVFVLSKAGAYGQDPL